MSFTITCPYCFRKMMDEEVLFRSEKVNLGECDLIPDDYDDIDDFVARYNGADKDSILTQYRDWEFFAETIDPVYEAFWENFNGTTEFNPADEILRVKAYRRRIIDPSDISHRRYLKRQNGDDYFIRDDQGMVSQIELYTGEKCNRRVCKHCHNPLPDNYGKNTVKFVTVIGITGAGKTVYLSQLLQKMKTYAVKAGLSAVVTNASVRTFLEKNVIAAAEPLPGSTPATQLQQPLFYEMVRDAKEHGKITETFVLFDVAGEVFKENSLINKFAPFVEHVDGVIVLIDPMQFEVVGGVANEGVTLDEPVVVLDAVQNIVTRGNVNEKCDIPFAVCISKADTEVVQRVLSDDLSAMLLDDVHGVKDTSGFNLPLFNAKEYNPILNELYSFVQNNELVLAQQMQTNYSRYAYFAFTALGCDVGTFKKFRDHEYERIKKECKENKLRIPSQYVEIENGEYPDMCFESNSTGLVEYKCPIGPVLPKRVEEPLLWLFHKLGYIDVNEPIDDPSIPKVPCPQCGSIKTEDVPEDEREYTTGWGPFKKKHYINRRCECGYCWEHM